MKLVKLLANLGYGSRREVQALIKKGAVTGESGRVLGEKDFPPVGSIRFRGEPLDPPSPLILVMNKPVGYTCSTDDPGAIVFDLLPARYACRNPVLHTIGRLDKETSGLLLLTDDGKLSHRIIHPKSGCAKVYHATLDRPLAGNEAEIFSSGTLVLHNETKPLLPAQLTVLSPTEVLVTLHEGRYHQVRRMFAAVGNHVLDLKRISIGGFHLPDDFEGGDWRQMTAENIEKVFGIRAN
ncbi:MAG: pseudouridine synthase [Verrucomicrobiota bacterium]